MGIAIRGKGTFLPGSPVSNNELKERTAVESSGELIRERTGIEGLIWKVNEWGISLSQQMW